jgi:hypothetical protein
VKNLSEGEFKKRITEKFAPPANMPESLKSLLRTLNDVENKAIFDILDEVCKDFLKDFTDDDLFVLKEYGLEDDAKLHPDAIKLKTGILARWAKQSVPAFFKWFGTKPS